MKATDDKPRQKAVTYVRVSSEAQVRKGQGAKSQASRCADFARMKHYEVVRVFDDRAVSGAIIDRPGMKALLAFVREHRGENIRVLIDDISRLARDIEAHLALRTAITSAGGHLESPSIEFGEDSDAILVENLLASVSQHQRQKNAEQTRNRMEARMRMGLWPFLPCIGFRYEHRDGMGKVLTRHEPIASIIQEALELFACGHLQTQAEVKRFFETKPDFPRDGRGLVRNQLVNDILTRPLYAGMIEHKPWNVPLMKARHEGFVSFETWQKVQDRLAGKAYAPARSDLNVEFPLRGSVACGDCGNMLTACFSKSKTGKRHPYYLCHTKGCVSYRKSIRRDDLEGAFETLLEGLTPSKTLFDIVRTMFADAWNQRAQQARAGLKSLKNQLAKVDKQIEGLLDRIVTASSPGVIGAYERKVEALGRDKLVIEEKMQNTGKPKRPFGEMFELTLQLLADPCNLYKNGSPAEKKAVLRLCFDGPLRYSRFRKFEPTRSSVFSRLSELGASTERMAERMGFEPTIQLPVYALSRGAPSATRPPLLQGLRSTAARAGTQAFAREWENCTLCSNLMLRTLGYGQRVGPGALGIGFASDAGRPLNFV